MDEDISNLMETRFRRHWWGFGAGLIIIWVFAGPLLRHTYATDMWVIGFCVGGVMFTGYWSAIYFNDWDGKVMLVAALLASVLTAYVASPVIDRAIVDSLANDRRCLAIQNDMLSASPKRSDGPDLFQALGCQPRGQGGVYAPPSTR